MSLIISGAVCYYGLLSTLGGAELRAGAGVLAQIGATMLGFVLASLSILATIANTRLLRNMQRTGHYALLLQRMFGCVAAFGFLTIAATIVLFLPTVKSFHAYPLLGLAVFSLLVLLDISKKFWTVLHHLHPASSEPS